jgi:hypothetical protein
MKYILGSGIVALACKKILGNEWEIIPFKPSRFYSTGVPAWGDDFIVYNNDVLEIIKDWGIDKVPLIFKRPISFGGQLVYNNVFVGEYLDKIGIDKNELIIDYFKTDYMVFNFSCLQMWNYLLKHSINEIKSFFAKYNKCKSINIKDHKILINNNDIITEIEYDKIISTIPFNTLSKIMNLGLKTESKDVYHYYIYDESINIENANQVLIADQNIPFHKCTKIKHKHYLFESLEYLDNPYDIMKMMLGDKFDIIKVNMIENGHPKKHDIPKIENITCIGRNAQSDPLMDIGSCLRRIYNLKNKNKI